jgi:hypothetical protein
MAEETYSDANVRHAAGVTIIDPRRHVDKAARIGHAMANGYMRLS